MDRTVHGDKLPSVSTSGASQSTDASHVNWRGLLLNAFWNYIGWFLEAAVALVVTAYVLRRVQVGEYGVLLLALSLADLLLMLDLGLTKVLTQAFVARKSERDFAGLNSILITALISASLIGMLGLLICYGLAAILPGPFHISQPLVPVARNVLLICGLGSLFVLVGSVLSSVCEAWQRYDLLSRFRVISALFRAAIVCALVAKGMGIVGVAIGTLGGEVVRVLLLAFSVHHFFDGVRFTPALRSFAAIKSTWRVGLWASLDNISGKVAFSFDTVVLGVFSTVSSVAVFGVGRRIPQQLSAFIEKVSAVLLPAMAEQNAATDSTMLRRQLVGSSQALSTAMIPIVMVFCLFARPAIRWWAGAEYESATAVMLWLLLVIPVYCLAHPAFSLMYARNQVASVAQVAAAEAVANLCLSIILVRRYGAVGSAAGTVIPHTIFTLLWLVPQACRIGGIRLYDLVLPLLKIPVMPALAAGATIGAIWWFRGIDDITGRAIAALLGCSMYACVCFLLWKQMYSTTDRAGA